MPQIFKTDNKKDWLELRAKDVTSTEISALCDSSPYMSEFELYHKKKEGDLGEIPDNKAMLWGRRMEPVIAQAVKEDFGLDIRLLDVYMRHDDEPNMGSSFDYEIINHADGPGILEIKNVAYSVYKEQWTETEAPEHIELQLQQQLEISGREWGVIAAFVGFGQIVLYTRKRDHEMGKNMRKLVSAFWKRVEDSNPPAPNFDLDSEYIIAIHSRAGDAVADHSNDVHLTNLAKEYKCATEGEKEHKDRKKAIKAEFYSMVGDECSRVKLGEGYSLNCSMTSTTEGTLITESMIGNRIGGKKGFRQFRISIKKEGK